MKSDITPLRKAWLADFFTGTTEQDWRQAFSEGYTDRNIEIVREYRDNNSSTYASIAAKHGIGGERVRTIICHVHRRTTPVWQKWHL